ncbi:hypothetical protein EVC45_08240 [Paraburkholderia sp. UYCP14C]|nr:hypothetical protein [Paraburkholderia sp. UYCP14C]RZF30458.1 hypothetical protein EVC45_08240 [Paraburkholderia sp. UYCP14C]
MAMNTPDIRNAAQRSADAAQQRESYPSTTAPQTKGATGTLVNGPAAAAILAAGIGCFLVGLFALAGDASPAISRLFTFYKPTGALSGVTTTAIVIWLLTWYGLSRRWGDRTVQLGRIIPASFVLLALAVLLTFPPFMDLLQGK